MDFHQLRVFIEVAKQKNFSRAAENIFLSQPTVSAHVKALENEIGAPLFDRGRRELQLTEAGEILYQYTRQLLGIKDEALTAIQKKHGIIKGHLEIASSSVPGAYLLPQLLLSFRRQHPEVTFSVLLRDTRQVLQSIRDYTFDLGFGGETGNKEELGHIRLVEDELILITPPGTGLPYEHTGKGKKGMALSVPSVKAEAVFELPFILREPGSATRLVFEKALKEYYGSDARLKVIAYLESQEAIKEAVKTGLGATIISFKAVEDELKNGAVEGYRVEGLPLKRNFYLIFRKKRLLPLLSQSFLDFTVQYYATNAP